MGIFLSELHYLGHFGQKKYNVFFCPFGHAESSPSDCAHLISLCHYLWCAMSSGEALYLPCCAYGNMVKTVLLFYKWLKFLMTYFFYDIYCNYFLRLLHLYKLSQTFNILKIVWSIVIHNVDWKWKDLFIFILDASCPYCWLSLRELLNSCSFFIYKRRQHL